MLSPVPSTVLPTRHSTTKRLSTAIVLVSPVRLSRAIGNTPEKTPSPSSVIVNLSIDREISTGPGEDK